MWKSVFLCCAISSSLLSNAQTKIITSSSDPELHYIQNKGQLTSLNGSEDIGRFDYYATNRGLSVYVNSNEFAIQLTKEEERVESANRDLDFPANRPIPSDYTIERVHVTFLHANAECVPEIASKPLWYNNYYLAHSPTGILNCQAVNTVQYSNIYPEIAIIWQSRDGLLAYDFLIDKGGDYQNIQFEITGAESIRINQEGELIIKTSLDSIVQSKPLAMQDGQPLPAEWQIQDDNISFKIEGVNPEKALLIDPTIRNWGTYYGGNAGTIISKCKVDRKGNLYTTGWTTSSTGIATNGTYNSGNADAFLAKWDSSGALIWGLYYGGNFMDEGKAVDIDTNFNIYFTGQTSSSGLATSNAYQPTLNASANAYLAKIDSIGRLIWATYYGDITGSWGTCIAIDKSQNIVFGGDYVPIAGSGYANSFVVKFLPNGNKVWHKNFGGNGFEETYCVAVDGSNNVYCSGRTSSAGFATVGSHQSILGGGVDAFLTKLNSSGTLLWSTYYGGMFQDAGFFCGLDDSANVYLAGFTRSPNNITTPGAWKSILSNTGANNGDAFLAKFDSNGVRQYGTYFGGNNGEMVVDGCLDDLNRIHLVGFASTGLSTLNPTQPNHGGGDFDAMIITFSRNGQPTFATYLGGIYDDDAYGVATYKAKTLYVVGSSNSPNGITTPGSHQSIFTSSGSGFINAYGICAVNTGVIQNGGTFTAQTNNATYQWIDCITDLPISGANGKIFTATTNGSYAVAVTQFGCTDTSACFSINNVDINESEAGRFDLYPNPIVDFLTINSKAAIGLIEVYDLNGRCLFRQDAKESSFVVDFTDWKSAVYILYVDNQPYRIIKI